MLYWAVVFLVVEIIAGLFGFGGIASASASRRSNHAAPPADPERGRVRNQGYSWQRWSDRFRERTRKLRSGTRFRRGGGHHTFILFVGLQYKTSGGCPYLMRKRPPWDVRERGSGR